MPLAVSYLSASELAHCMDLAIFQTVLLALWHFTLNFKAKIENWTPENYVYKFLN